MKCRVAREWLRVRIDAPLEAEVATRLQAHLESCSRCAAEARDVQQLHAWVAELPLALPSANFDWRLRLRLSKAEHDEKPPLFETEVERTWPSFEFWGAAAAAAVVVVAAGLWLLQPSPEAGLSRSGPHAAVVDNRPARPDAASQLTPVRDGFPVGPQQPLPNSYLLFPQAGPPVPPDTLPAVSPATSPVTSSATP